MMEHRKHSPLAMEHAKLFVKASGAKTRADVGDALKALLFATLAGLEVAIGSNETAAVIEIWIDLIVSGDLGKEEAPK